MEAEIKREKQLMVCLSGLQVSWDPKFLERAAGNNLTLNTANSVTLDVIETNVASKFSAYFIVAGRERPWFKRALGPSCKGQDNVLSSTLYF